MSMIHQHSNLNKTLNIFQLEEAIIYIMLDSKISQESKNKKVSKIYKRKMTMA